MRKIYRQSASRIMVGISGVALCALGVLAQDSTDADSKSLSDVDEIVVVGSRLPKDLTSFAGSVSVLSAEDLEKQTRITMNLGELLGNSVPGLAVSKGSSASNFSQVLRGRKPAVLIDGSPQTVPIREAGRDLRIISPAAIGQIEVIRGSTALYGMGGAGGVINYITKRPTDDGYQFRTDIALSTSLTNVDTDSFSYEVAQSVTGKEGAFDFIVTALYEDTGQFFDANGDMIAPDPELGQGGIAETETTSLFVKLGYDIDENQRIEGSFGRYRAAQDTDYFVNIDDFATGYQTVITKEAFGNSGDYDAGYIIDPRTSNDFASFSYTHDDVMGSSVKLSGNYQDYSAVFGNTPFFLWGLFPRETNLSGGGQTDLVNEKYGLRLDVDTPIDAVNGRILWGVDYLSDTTSQVIFDTREPYLSPTDTRDLSLFAQFEGDIIDGVNVRGGFRWVNFTADIDDYNTIEFCVDPNAYVYEGIMYDCGATLGGNAVTGGKLKYNALLPNVGVLVDVTDNWKVFGSYSEGFIVADLGRTLRDRYFDSDISGLQNSPQLVTTFEGGIRGAYDDLSVEVVAYYSKSEDGTNLVPLDGNPDVLVVQRAPERIWGLELSVDWQVNDALNLVASYSWIDGKYDPGFDETIGYQWEQMETWRIPPQKLYAQVLYEFAENWSLFVQGLYSFDQNLFGSRPLEARTPGQFEIDNFFTLDASVTGKVGPGYVTLSVANMLNADYHPVVAQAIGAWWDPTQFYKAPGARASLRYTIEY